MLVSQSIFRLLRNVVARWNQCLICGYLRHVPHSDLQCLKNENFWFFSAIFTHLDRSFNIVHLLNPSGYGLLRYGSRRLQNFKPPRCRLHTFPILGGTDIGGARYACDSVSTAPPLQPQRRCARPSGAGKTQRYRLPAAAPATATFGAL